MNTLMIVGADRLGTITARLKSLGFGEILHMDGRKTRMVRQGIPKEIDAVLILTDFINHNVAKKITEQAKERSIPVCYAKRSWCSIYQSLAQSKNMCKQCPFLQK